MDYAWYGPPLPDGILTSEDNARITDGPFEISLLGGSLMVGFADVARKAEALAVGLGYVEELALRRGRGLTWSPHFRSQAGGKTVHEAYVDAAARVGVMVGKTITRVDGSREVVRADSIDAFRSEARVRSNENLREVRRYLAASLDDPRHEDLQRAHDRLRDEIGARSGLDAQQARDRALAELVNEPASWSADIGQSLAAMRHVRSTPLEEPRLSKTECASRLRRLYAAALTAWCP